MTTVEPSVAPRAPLDATVSAAALTPAALHAHWQAHRRLTRRAIARFPEEPFGTFAVGGLRTASGLVGELLEVGVPMLREIVTGERQSFGGHQGLDRDEALRRWDEGTAELDALWARLDPTRLGERATVFGSYEGAVIDHLLYAVDNEVHHRGQLYVYLRALGVEPPPFWARD